MIKRGRKVGLGLLLLISSHGIAFGEEHQNSGFVNPLGQTVTLRTLLRSGERVIGEADVTFTADNNIELPKSTTLALLATLLPDEALEQLARSNNEDILNMAHFSQVGYPLSVDPATFQIDIAIPLNATRLQRLSLARRNEAQHYLMPSPFNGYLNVYLSASYDTLAEANAPHRHAHYQAHRFEGGIHLIGWQFEYESELAKPSQQQLNYRRTATRLIRDFPEAGTRFTVGDHSLTGQRFQSYVDMLGISVNRNFNQISTRNVRPTATQQFTLSRASSVDVLVGGVIVQRLTLPPGRYNLADIPLAAGNNDVVLQIRDEAGNEESLSFAIATGRDLIEVGEFEYAIGVGLPKTLSTDGPSYQRDARIVHGYIEYGVTPAWTLGVNSQLHQSLGTNKVIQVGLRSLYALPFGMTELNYAVSEHPIFQRGQAVRVAYDTPDNWQAPFNTTFSAQYEYFSSHYTNISHHDVALSDNVQPIKHALQAQLNLDLSDRLRVGLFSNYQHGYDNHDTFLQSGASFSGNLFHTRATWGVSVSYRDHNVDEDTLHGSVTLSIPFNQQHRLVTRYQTQQDSSQVNYTFRDGLGNVGGRSAYISARHDRDNDAQINGGYRYTANRFNIAFDHSSRLTEIQQGEETHTTRIDLATGLVFSAKDDFVAAISRPVGESYAIIQRHRSLDQHPIEIAPSHGFPRATITTDMPAVIPDLLAYNGQVITYQVDNLPPGYDLGDGVFSLYPEYGQSYLLTIGSDAIITVIGQLYDKHSEQPISLIAGHAHWLGDDEQAPIAFFTNRRGQFAISGMKPGQYRLQLVNEKEQEILLHVPDADPPLVRKGVIYVE
ncbi:fimbria/pilus outer membrane usher protein [Thaumasiovibrio subtropicus]|uniref:fimbria/pilus outer membrane usher protein n=1 Tax=Thaumasiovibrio subtropicus TaxID=1891207 RepID=UPI000B360149|nr:fimbria/pilus outer membrane usher protein [Thaumasiovibrio subtropicus]